MNAASVCFVREDQTDLRRSAAGDLAAADHLARSPPCWVVVVGREQERRSKLLRERLHVEGIASNGVSIFAPDGLDFPLDRNASEHNLTALTAYLFESLLQQALKSRDLVQVHLPDDLPPTIVAAVVEAAVLLPRVTVLSRNQLVGPRLSWESRRFRLDKRSVDRGLENFIGGSRAAQTVRDAAARYAPYPFPVLLIGETGTGKEVVAQGLHNLSEKSGRFMPVNAAGLAPDLAESLLFGHEKGAFTGAVRDRSGRVKEAADGTFFLDEVFNLDPLVQGKLLRALNKVHEGIIEVLPVGSVKPVEKVRARLIVAAQRDPRSAPDMPGIAAMREDLFFRVAVGLIRLPPLRERKEDIPELCRHFLAADAPDYEITDDAISALAEHDWPGNIRELRLVLLRAIMDGTAGRLKLDADAIRRTLDGTRIVDGPAGELALKVPCNLDLELKRRELATMLKAETLADGNHTHAGRLLGIKGAKNFKRRLENAKQRALKLQSDEQPGEDGLR